MMTPAHATTQRLLTPVRRTRPTFSENAVYGNELKMPPKMVATPSARTPAATSSFLMRLPTISPVAKIDPVDSTATTSRTTIIDTMATRSHLGAPKANGGVKPSHAASPTELNVASPHSQATKVPTTKPRSTAIVAMKPRKKRCISTISRMVPSV